MILCVPDGAIADGRRRSSPSVRGSRTSAARPRSRRSRRTSAAIQRPSAADLHACARRRTDRRRLGRGHRRRTDGGARGRLRALAASLGLRPFDLDDDRRAIYHAGASIASNFLVTLHRAAVRARSEAAGAPPEALLPLMRRTIDNDFDLTGPIARGDRATVDAHLAAIRHESCRTSRRSIACSPRPRADEDRPHRRRVAAGTDARSAAGTRVGFVPTMGALHEGHVALIRAARAACDVSWSSSIFVNPKQFNDAGRPGRGIRAGSARPAIARRGGPDLLFVPARREIYPAGRCDGRSTMAGAALGFEGNHRPGTLRRRRARLPEALRDRSPDVVFLGQKDAQQVAVLRQLVRDVQPRTVDLRVVPTVRDPTVSRCRRATRACRPTSGASARDSARASRRPRRLTARGAIRWPRRAWPLDGARRRLRRAVAEFDTCPTLVIAATAGATRLIDNVPSGRSPSWPD